LSHLLATGRSAHLPHFKLCAGSYANPAFEAAKGWWQTPDVGPSRAFSTEKLPIQVLSNMLWAAFPIS